MSAKKGFWANLFGSNKSGGCCNMEIIDGDGCCETATKKEPKAPGCVCGSDCSTLEAADKEIKAGVFSSIEGEQNRL